MRKEPFHRALPFVLAVIAFVVTGCPHNDYTVQLKPDGAAIVRTLTFNRADGVNTNTGMPEYQAFDPAELSAIAGLYPANGLTNTGDVHVVQGTFESSMPDDVGGAGVYTNLATSLGSAGFYVERFRGNDDLAGITEQRFQAADQLTDILIGWSRSELGRKPGYGQLHEFLDVNFRHDLKNASSYCWEGQIISDRETNAATEFMVRFGQYLYERGYFEVGELPNLVMMFDQDHDKAIDQWLQRLVARKMGVPDGAPIPGSLAFLGNDEAMEKSFTNYFAHTDLYRKKINEWKAHSAPNTAQPTPDAVAGEFFDRILAIDFNLFGDTPDHLTVKLTLPSAPLHSNGRWSEADDQEIWSTDIQGRTNMNHLPFSCYANWVQADEGFQTNHFGKVAFSGDDLAQYCLWRCSQAPQQGGEWDEFLARLKPGDDLPTKVDAFRFSGEEDATNSETLPSAYPRKLLKTALN